MPPTRRRPTDDDLLDAARVIFAQHGYYAASMDAIARQANSTKPTLYAHFDSKDALFTKVFEREAEIMRSALLPVYEVLPGRPLPEMLRTAFGAAMMWGAQNMEGTRIIGLVFDGIGPNPALGRDLLDTLIDAIAVVIDDALRKEGCDQPLLVRMLAAMLWGSAIEVTRTGRELEVPPQELIDVQVSYALGGLEAILAEVRGQA